MIKAKTKGQRVRYFIFVAIVFSVLWETQIAFTQVTTPAIPVSSTSTMSVGSQAEWNPAKIILTHTPSDELFLGIIHPAAALFERPFNLQEAAVEHKKYIRLLRRLGARVYTVVDVLLEGTQDKKGRAVPGPKLEALRSFASQSLIIDSSALPEDQKSQQEHYKQEVIAALDPVALVKILLLRPTVHLQATPGNTGFAATYEESPVMNLYFLRDQMITTAKGVVISKMNSSQRAPETQIIKFVLAKLGIKPVYEVTDDGRLEGGDYFSAGDTAFIGQGLRTNAEAIRQLLQHSVFGLHRVVVVKDPWQNQSQMHLDTYFNIISPQLAVLVRERMDTKSQSAVENMRCKVDVYELEDGGYKLKIKDIDFQQYLEKVSGFTLIPVSKDDQLRYGINFLTVRSDRILAIDGVSSEYKKALHDAGVHATWMDFSNLTGGYGAAHCSTQVLLRENTTEKKI